MQTITINKEEQVETVETTHLLSKDSDTECICCGAEIPEGYGWVCPQCLSK